jgi:hypothetical protein
LLGKCLEMHHTAASAVSLMSLSPPNDTKNHCPASRKNPKPITMKAKDSG